MIGDHPLFPRLNSLTGLSEGDKAALCGLQRSAPRVFNAWQVIIREGETPDAEIIVKSGWAWRYRALLNGRRQGLSVLLPGDQSDFADSPIQPAGYTIEALTTVEIEKVAFPALSAIKHDRARIASAFHLARLRLQASERELILSLGARTAEQRLGQLLCDLFGRLKAIRQAQYDACPFELTENQLGELTGLSVVQVNHSLSRLRQLGLANIENNRLTIPKITALRSHSEMA